MAATVVEHLRGHYEVREIHFGKDYVWCPECVVVECDCGSRVHFIGSDENAICQCGQEHTNVVRDEMDTRSMPGENEAPWRELRFGPERSEYRDWLELNDLD